MTGFEKAIVISLAVLGVMSTRFLPFLIFRPNRPTPPLVRYLGKWLGPAVFGLLVVYCFRQTIATGDRLIPMLAATLATVVCQLRWHSMILSMPIGTALYMILIRLT
mgnify:FL=1